LGLGSWRSLEHVNSSESHATYHSAHVHCGQRMQSVQVVEGRVWSGLLRLVGTGVIWAKGMVRAGKSSGLSLICQFITEATCGHGPQGHHGIKASFGLRFVARASCTGHCGTKANFGRGVDRLEPSVGRKAGFASSSPVSSIIVIVIIVTGVIGHRHCYHRRRCHHRHRCWCTSPVSSL
jgi:hypothetical protein